MFNVIGQKCGGLLDIAKCTTDFTFMNYAIVRFRGNIGGCTQEQIDIHCWGTKITIRTFSLKERNLRIHGAYILQESVSKDEDDGDVAKWIGKGILDGSHKSEAFLHASDTGCTKLEYQTTKREVVGCSAKSAIE